MNKDENGVVLSAEQVSEIKQTVKALEKQKEQASEEVRAVLKGLVDVIESDKQHIVRSMTFPEVYLQAGIALLHYFGRIAHFVHPEISIKLRVIQDGNYVKLGIEVAEKDHNRIEELLENYGFVLKGKMPLNELVSEPNQLMEWKQKLDLSALEVKITRDLLEEPDGVRNQDIEALGVDAKALHHLVGDGVSGLNALTAVIDSVLEENRKQINDALLILQKKLSEKVTEADEAEIKEALGTVLRYEPDVFKKIHNIAAGESVSGRAADTLLSWIASLSGVMPR